MSSRAHSTPASLPVTGLILAGGRGLRMGGADKGLQALAGRPLVAHVIERLAPQVDRLLVSANRNIAAYAAFGHPVVADRIAGYAGPLAGLHAGLGVCATPLLVLVPCDAPMLPLDLVSRLFAALGSEDADVAMAETTDGLQPTFALMRREVLPPLARYLESGGRRMQEWCRGLCMRGVRFDDAHGFANLNTPESLASYRHG